MKILLTGIVSLLLIFSACHSDNQQEVQTKTSTADTGHFFPLGEFFKSQIEYVDLRNFTITQKIDKDGKKDSMVISKDQFSTLAQAFLEKDISSPKIKNLYRETVFQDLSTGSYTLNYTPIQSQLAIQNIDVLLDDQHKIVKRIFIRSNYLRGDTTITEHYSWKANKSFLIARTYQTKNGHTSNTLTFVNWNDKP